MLVFSKLALTHAVLRPKKSPVKKLKESLLELIKKTSTELPKDVDNAIQKATKNEAKGTRARYAMDIVCENLRLAKEKEQPTCQDTGSILFFVKCPKGFDQKEFEDAAKWAVAEATAKGFLRQNSVDSLTGKNSGNNLGLGSPYFHFEQVDGTLKHALSLSNGRSAISCTKCSGGLQPSTVEVCLILKGGGCENCGAQYSLPNKTLGAERDLEGVKKCILDAVLQAQGKGCGPGILGVCVGGDRATSYAHSKEQLLRTLDDKNQNATLAKMEDAVMTVANKLDIGPMGFGGATTLLGCKIGALNRLPASFFVSVSYMCWADRRQGAKLDKDGGVMEWIY